MKLQIDFEIPEELYYDMRFDFAKYTRDAVVRELVKEIMKNDSIKLYSEVQDGNRNWTTKFKGELYVYNASDIEEAFKRLNDALNYGLCDSSAEFYINQVGRILSTK